MSTHALTAFVSMLAEAAGVSAPLVAALAAALGVWGAWEALGALEEAALPSRVRRVLVPLRLAGRAGREPTDGERRRLAVLGAGALLAGGWLVAGPVAGLALGAAGPAAVARLVAARRRRWRRELAAGAPMVARALADALAGGHGVRGALEVVGRTGGLTGAAGREVAAGARRLALGARTEDVLEAIRRRAHDPVWDTLVAAILLQRDAGGDLAALLRSVAEAQEQARRVEGEARAMTAQARATAKLVAGMPFAGLGLGELASPGTLVALVSDPRSGVLVTTALGLGALSFVVVGRLAKVGL